MEISKVLLSTKKTALEYYKEQTDFIKDVLPADELTDVRSRHDAHYASLDKIRKILDEHGIEFSRSYMPYSEYEDFKGMDLIIALGGDGTVLNSSQYVLDRTPMLTVRSDRRSYGILCTIEAEDFERYLRRIMKDDYRIEEWTRVEGRFGARKLFALNEVFVGTRHNPSMARYEISYGEEKEMQMSSGVVITSGTGSTGWYANIPESDGKFPRTAKELRFIVREHDVAKRYSITKGVVKPGETLSVKSKMNVDGCISFDGDYGKRMFDFGRGEELRVHAAEMPVSVVTFKDDDRKVRS